MAANDTTNTPKKKKTKKTQLSQTESTHSQEPLQDDTNNQPEEKIKKPSTPKRTKSPGVRVIGSRIYDSKNGKTCHQCRQKTLDVVVTCTNQTNNKQCPLKLCKACLQNRYGENVEEVAASGDWICPRCRGICNCSFCMKKRGFAPTGVLVHTAKQNGCASVSNLLININDPTVTKEINGRKRGSVSIKETTDEPETKRVKEENDSENEKEKMAEDMKEEHNIVEIELPQGTELTNLEGIDLPSGDVGHALQLLEFCETFGEVLDLKKGDPEILLRELTCANAHKRNKPLIVDFHIRLLSLIGEDSGKKYSGESWVEDFQKCIIESKFPSKESLLEGFNLQPNGYDDMNFSKKLRLLNFLCDEALETVKMRLWIEERNIEEKKKAKERVIANREKEKNMKKKVQDEVAKAILLRNGIPLSISEQKDLVSRIKAETAQTLANSLDMRDVAQESYVVRLEPVCLDRNGFKLWKLRSSSDKIGILLQDSCYRDMLTSDEKWFAYNDQEKALVDQYISTSRNFRE
uniref:uncharacterized protein LOC122580041 isoform X2 n=1 Tax=Erigeron canadensis TaxID=72917 RepID=UPI001CB92C63|nr:uncharacterized protein LOC122580041 isoform X2 [Erigeron canadensis]